MSGTYINDDLQTVARSLMVWLDDDQKRSIETALQALDALSAGIYQLPPGARTESAE